MVRTKNLGGLMSKRWSIAPVFAVAMLISLLLSACGGGSTTGTTTTSSNLGTPGEYTCVSGSIVADGSTALQPLVEAVAKDYQKKCSAANITVNPGGSKTGLSDVESGAVQIGDSDIYHLPSQSDLVDHQVAVVIFTLIVNS